MEHDGMLSEVFEKHWLTLIGLLTVVFAIVVGLDGENRWRDYKDAAEWPVTQGTITTSEVDFRPTRSYDYLDFEYRYVVDGHTFTSTRMSPNCCEGNQLHDAGSYVRKYPVGGTVDVHYSPADPSNAVLETDFPIAGRLFGVAVSVALAVLGALPIAFLGLPAALRGRPVVEASEELLICYLLTVVCVASLGFILLIR
jgi:hypothetical protein